MAYPLQRDAPDGDMAHNGRQSVRQLGAPALCDALASIGSIIDKRPSLPAATWRLRPAIFLARIAKHRPDGQAGYPTGAFAVHHRRDAMDGGEEHWPNETPEPAVDSLPAAGSPSETCAIRRPNAPCSGSHSAPPASTLGLRLRHSAAGSSVAIWFHSSSVRSLRWRFPVRPIMAIRPRLCSVHAPGVNHRIIEAPWPRIPRSVRRRRFGRFSRQAGPSRGRQ